MKLPGVGRAITFWRSARNTFSPPPFILAYHRVADVATDPHLLAVSPKHFAEQLEVLKKNTDIVSLDRLTTNLCEGRSLRKQAAITFDDGYLDNLTTAKPLLQRFEAPATVYVATSFCGECFWWEELVQLLLHPGKLPKTICLEINGKSKVWSTGDTGEYSAADFIRNQRWSFMEIDSPTPRHRLFRDLCELLTSLPHILREEVMAQLRSMWNPGSDQPNGLARGLFSTELAELGADGLVTIGAHTVHHEKLPLIAPDAAESEINESKRWLEEVLGRTVNDLAYPHGAHSLKIAGAAKAAGFKSAVTCEERTIERKANLFTLPRFTVRDWNGDQFAQKLNDWLT